MEFFNATNYSKLKYFIYAFLAICLVFTIYTLIITNQSVGWDAGMGIKMTENTVKNIPFNYYQHPAPDDLSKDELEFVTWWSPGQFALPLLIKAVTGSKISTAVKVLTFICMLAAAIGIYKLYDYLVTTGHSALTDKPSQKLIVYTALLFTLMQPFFWGNLYIYDGGGLLILAYGPWFIYWVVKIEKLNFYSVFTILIGALIGFFLKTSFTCILLGALLYLFLSTSIAFDKPLKNQNFRSIIINGIILAAILFSYIIITRICFLGHNRNIADSSLGLRIQPRIIFFPIVAPVLGIFNFNFLDKTYQWIIASGFIIPFYYLVIRSKNVTIHYKIIVTGFAGACIVFFSFLYFINIDVSYELRHFLIISILILPLFFIVFHQWQFVKYVLSSVLVLTFCLNIYQFAKQFAGRIIDKKPVDTHSGFRSSYPNSVINKIHNLDSIKNNAIFYFKAADPSVALEIRNNRVLLEDNYINFHFDNKARAKKTLYYGINSGEIYVIYGDTQIKTDSVLYLTRFEKYKKFDAIYKSDGYTILRAVPSN